MSLVRIDSQFETLIAPKWVNGRNEILILSSVSFSIAAAERRFGASKQHGAGSTQRTRARTIFLLSTNLSVHARGTYFWLAKYEVLLLIKKGRKFISWHPGHVFLRLWPQNWRVRWKTFLTARGRWNRMSAVAGASIIPAPRQDANSHPDAASSRGSMWMWIVIAHKSADNGIFSTFLVSVNLLHSLTWVILATRVYNVESAA